MESGDRVWVVRDAGIPRRYMGHPFTIISMDGRDVQIRDYLGDGTWYVDVTDLRPM
jgi:hypothetical protein